MDGPEKKDPLDGLLDEHTAAPEAAPPIDGVELPEDPSTDTATLVAELRVLLDQLEAKVGLGE